MGDIVSGKITDNNNNKNNIVDRYDWFQAGSIEGQVFSVDLRDRNILYIYDPKTEQIFKVRIEDRTKSKDGVLRPGNYTKITRKKFKNRKTKK